MKKIRGILFGRYRMKYIHILLIIILGALVMGSSQETSKKDSSSKENSIKTQISTNGANNYTNNVDEKFLITSSSVGYFKVGKQWQKIAKEVYNYKYEEGYGQCIDACCTGGFGLLKNTGVDKNGEKKYEVELTIIVPMYSDNADKNAFKNNPKVFFVWSDNCSGWYLKDKVEAITVISESFKTKEGIGIGTRLKDIVKMFGAVDINIGWLEEDPYAISFHIPPYPDIDFGLNPDDAIGGYDGLSEFEFNTIRETTKSSHFKEDTKISRIIVSGTKPVKLLPIVK